MTIFLTSSPTGPLDGSRPVDGLDRMNCFVDQLRAVWPENARQLIIAASPYAFDQNDEMTDFFRNATLRTGLSCTSFDLLDARTADMPAEQIRGYDVIWLGGGHVPTENRFFCELGLKEILQPFSGILIAMSAGSMNCASTVYVQPEEPGEALDPNFPRFIEGLGLTDTNILPHYQMVTDYLLDGMRLFEDITYPDSYGNDFLALCDGSYVLIRKEGSRVLEESIWGEAYRIRDGKCVPCEHN